MADSDFLIGFDKLSARYPTLATHYDAAVAWFDMFDTDRDWVRLGFDRWLGKATLIRKKLPLNLQIAPGSGKIAPARCGWAPLWNENHSRRYGLSEEQG